MTFQPSKDYQESLAKLLLGSSLQLSIPKLNDTLMNQNPLEGSDSTSDRDSCEYDRLAHSLLSSSRKISKNCIRRDKYSVIPNEIRLELIDAVMNRGEKIKRVASRLGINYSSAKSIYQVFKKEGRLDKKSSKKNRVNAETISPEANFINQSNKTQKNLHEESLQLPSRPQEAQVERAKPLEPLAVPKFTLAELDNLAFILPRSETMSLCSTNGLSFSRICSGDSEMHPLGHKRGESATFFQLLENKEQGNEMFGRNSAFSKVSKQKSQNSVVSKPDIHIPEYQPTSSHLDALYQLKDNNLLQGSDSMTCQLNGLRSINNGLLPLRNQSLLPFEVQQKALREQQIKSDVLINAAFENKIDAFLKSALEDRLREILPLNNIGNQNTVAQKDGATLYIPPLRL